jgi:hypothetical protein
MISIIHLQIRSSRLQCDIKTSFRFLILYENNERQRSRHLPGDRFCISGTALLTLHARHPATESHIAKMVYNWYILQAEFWPFVTKRKIDTGGQ